MSLKNIGKLGEYASSLNEVDSLADLIQTKQATKEQKEAFKTIRESLKGLDVDAASKKLQDLKLNENLSKELLTAASNSDLLSGSTDEINKGIKNFQNSSSIVDDLGSTFTGLGSSVESGLSSIVSFATANPYIAALMGIGAAITTAIVISGQLIETYDEANEKAKESAKAYEETQNTIHSLNSELQTSQERLNELQKLQDAGSITATEKEELETLKNKNVELERELKIQEKLAELQRQEANTDAINALNKTDASGDIGKTMTEIKNYLAGMQKNSEEKAKEQVQNNTPASSNSGTTPATAPTSSTPVTTSTSTWGDFFIKKSDSYPKNKLNTETSIVDRLKYLNYDSSFSARSQYYTAMGGSGVYTGSSSQNRWMIDQMKAHSGFARGGFIGDMIRAAGEDGIALVRRGEGIIPTNMVPEWNALIHHLPQLNNSVLSSIPEQKPNVSIEFGDIQMYEVNDPEEFTRQLKHAMLNNNSVRNILKDTTIGEALGRNSMIRYTR